MVTKRLNTKNYFSYVDIVFILLIFFQHFILKTLLKTATTDFNVFYILTITIWGITKTFSVDNLSYKITWTDLVMFILSLLIILNFIFVSKASIYYFKFWLYLSYILAFFLFRFSNKKTNNICFYNITPYIIVISAIIQSFTALLQCYQIIQTNNKYFKLLGSFTSPNFLGAYLGLGSIVIIWLIFVKKTKRKSIISLALLSLILFLSIILLSKSRTVWIAIITSSIVLIFTSKKTISIFKKIKTSRKIILTIGTVLVTVFSIFYLYQFKPESSKGRLLVSKISLLEIIKEPIKGYGLYSFAGKYNSAKAKYFKTENRSWEEIKSGTYSFTAFNDYILIAFELGTPFLILIITTLIFILVKTKVNIETRLGLAIVINISILALFNSPLNNPILVFVNLFGLSLILKHSDTLNFSVKKNKLITLYLIKPLLLTASVITIYFCGFKLIYQNEFNNLQISNKKLTSFLYKSNAIEDNIFSKFIIGRKLYRKGYKDRGKKLMEDSFRYSSAPKIGKLLAQIYINENKFKKAEEVLAFNINVEPYRFQPKLDFLNLMELTNQREKLLEIAEDIVNSPVKIHSIEVEKIKKIALKKIEKNSEEIKSKNRQKGELSEVKLIRSKKLNKTLPYKIYTPPNIGKNKKKHILYINDGFKYISDGKLPTLLDSLIINNKIEPLIAVFLSPLDKNDNWSNIRNDLFLCNSKFKSFFISELIPEVETNYYTNGARSILGRSFGGLAAAYIAIETPGYFKNVAMQSPAFNPCPNIYKLYKNRTKLNANFYISYGTGNDTENQDLPMIKILKEKEYNLKVTKIDQGNHDWKLWKTQLKEIMIHFYKKQETSNEI